jgi:hypothetical protein
MESYRASGQRSSGVHRDPEESRPPFSERHGDRPWRQANSDRGSRRQSHRVVRAGAIAIRSELWHANYCNAHRGLLRIACGSSGDTTRLTRPFAHEGRTRSRRCNSPPRAPPSRSARASRCDPGATRHGWERRSRPHNPNLSDVAAVLNAATLAVPLLGGTPPGGGVHGMCDVYAARALLHDVGGYTPQCTSTP